MISPTLNLSDLELTKIQNKVNDVIRENHKVDVHCTTYAKAVDEGALAFFGDTYDENVRTIKILSPWSYELCGGTHMSYTGGIGTFIITSEVGIGSGIRRLEAVTGIESEKLIINKFKIIKNATQLLKIPDEELIERISNLTNQISNNDKKINQLE